MQRVKQYQALENQLIGIKSRIGKNLEESISIKGVAVHLMERMLQRDLEVNLVKEAIEKPYFITVVKYDSEERPSHKFINHQVTLAINPKTGNVVTAYKTKESIRKKIDMGKELD